ncbi:MAG: TIGR04282 family arsenosugar biosynthesis glycosyltransferase [Phycisphaeraceae bacterium]
MAKRPVPGRVKTRLQPRCSPRQAAEVHAAMLRYVLARVAAHVAAGAWVLALDGNGADESAVTVDVPAGWRTVDQGAGDLGERLDHVWQAVGQAAVVFFGVDCPDVPAAALRAIGPALASHDAAVGPVEDGGYWTLAAGRYLPPLLEGIDWGSPSVYDQTVAAASRAGLHLSALPRWYDVDAPPDLAALQRRLTAAREPALVQLRHDLEHILDDPIQSLKG